MRLTIDFESRSACDIRKHGAWVYSEHPTTEVLCLAVKEHGKSAILWGRYPAAGTVSDYEVRSLVQAADIIEAHNAQFESFMWENVCVKKYGWAPLPQEKLRCSAAKAAMHSLPRSLEGACQALGLPVQKDMTGHRLMLKLCKPRAPRKDEPPSNPNDPHGYYWHESPEEMARLYQYCCQDVRAEEALSDALRDLPAREQLIWQLDQTINRRGIQADLKGCAAMVEMIEDHTRVLLAQLKKLTCGSVKTAKQVEQLRAYLRGLGVDLPDLSAATVTKALEGHLPHEIPRSILRIRQSLARSSGAKYSSIIDRTASDGRIRGSLLYHGANTGRWSGSGVQPHNFPSRIKTDEDPALILDIVSEGGYGLYKALCTTDPMSGAGAATRSVLTAKPGCDLLVADYSAVEGRGLAWLAGEESELEIYRSDKDPYIACAAAILKKVYEEVTKDERQSPGKVATLACGYQGSAGAARKFGGDVPYRSLYEGLLEGKELEDQINEDLVAEIIKPWRAAHPRTVAFWYDLEEACLRAVREPDSKPRVCRGVGFRVQDKFLMCRLPSNRLLFYYDPQIRTVTTSWGEEKEAVTYMTVNSMTKQWVRTSTYGGKSCENICQGICRDIMADAMLRLEAAGYPVVLTVHDEIISEVPKDFGSVEEYEALVSTVPAWAKGFPLTAKGWRGERYKK